MKLLVTLVVLAVGCGGVTALDVDAGRELALEGGAPDLTPTVDASTVLDGMANPIEPHPDAGEADVGSDSIQKPAVDGGGLSCAELCSSCSSSSARADAGPEYSSSSTCAAVVACVRADAGEASQLLGCHNQRAAGEWGGFFCVRDLLAAGCR